MADEERTGSCIACFRRDPLPELQPVCGVCRSRLRNQLREIPDYCAELASLGYVERDGRSTPSKLTYPDRHPAEKKRGQPVPHFEPVANVLPAGPVGGESGQPRVGGSREAPVPLKLDTTDLLAPARTLHLTARYPEQREDQVGHLAAASVLDGWCRDFAEGRRESVPQPFVTTQCRWLLDRLDWCFVEHPAVDEFAGEIGDLWHALRRATGRTEPKAELCVGVPCRAIGCDLKTLYRIPGSSYIECDSCGALMTEIEFIEWAALYSSALCGKRNGEWWCASPRKHDGPCAPAPKNVIPAA